MENFKELNIDALNDVNGGSVADALCTAASIAVGGIEVGYGMAAAAGGIAFLNPAMAASGVAALADGIYNIGTAC